MGYEKTISIFTREGNEIFIVINYLISSSSLRFVCAYGLLSIFFLSTKYFRNVSYLSKSRISIWNFLFNIPFQHQKKKRKLNIKSHFFQGAEICVLFLWEIYQIHMLPNEIQVILISLFIRVEWKLNVESDANVWGEKKNNSMVADGDKSADTHFEKTTRRRHENVAEKWKKNRFFFRFVLQWF